MGDFALRCPAVDGTQAVIQEHLIWLRLRGLRETTIVQRGYALRRLDRALPVPLLAVDEQMLATWQRALQLTPVAHCCEVGHVSQFYKWALLDGLISRDPTLRLIRPKKPRRLPRPISEEDLAVAIDCAPAHIRPWLILAAYEGLRAGEIARLERGHVLDTSTPPVMLIDGKGGHERIVPLSDRALRELRAHGLPSRGAVFRRLDGRPGHNSPARISQAANRYLHGIGITATLHALRHYFGTAIFERCQDLRVTQELLGHRDPATTAGYVAYSVARAVDAIRALDERTSSSTAAAPEPQTV